MEKGIELLLESSLKEKEKEKLSSRYYEKIQIKNN